MMSRNVMLSAFCFWRKERIINMYTKIGIPENNSLKSKIEELYEWCDKRDNDDELGKHILMNQ